MIFRLHAAYNKHEMIKIDNHLIHKIALGMSFLTQTISSAQILLLLTAV